MKQTPWPGEQLIFMRGDCVKFSLETRDAPDGQAFLRTNLGKGAVRRNEIIAHTRHNTPVLETDWHDLPMRRDSEHTFSLTLPLLEVGSFEAKTWLQPRDGSKNIWAEGNDNTCIKVEPAGTACSNTIYTLFPRQFGRNKFNESKKTAYADAITAMDKEGYTVIPPSGKFRDVIRDLDFIIGELRCRIIQLLPVHPAPTTYARMGRYGSPFAALDFFSVDPAYAEFDTKATPLEQFTELIDAIHARNARIFIDIPVNHTGWASQSQMAHPEWFERLADRTFVSPGAWGVVWADLCKLNYRLPEVHNLMAEVFLYWCKRGIDGFRCDAGYMLPFEAWLYIVARVRNEYPDTVFLLEGLGGPLREVRRLIGKAGLNWAYSELFQNYSREQIGSYLPDSNNTSMKCGLEVHFAETHDNNRLASTSHTYASMRTAMCAMFSHNGAFGFTNGVEWFADFKVVVHGAEPLNWGSNINQIDMIRRLNAIMEVRPEFHAGARLELIQQGTSNTLALRRTAPHGDSAILILVNLDDKNAAGCQWRKSDFDCGGSGVSELIGGTGTKINADGDMLSCRLRPGEVKCLSTAPDATQSVELALRVNAAIPERILLQEYRATVLDVISDAEGFGDVSHWPVDELARILPEDPIALCRRIFNTEMPPVTLWVDGRDQRRQVVIPERDMLLVKSKHPFHVEIHDNGRTVRSARSLPGGNREFFSLLAAVKGGSDCRIIMTTHTPETTRRTVGRLLFMHHDDGAVLPMEYDAAEVKKHRLYALCANRLGGMSQIRGAWAELHSKYDALLAGNIHRDFPVDRTVMFTRCRAWMVYKDYSREINIACLSQFRAGLDNAAQWLFSAPVGQGRTVRLQVSARLMERGNCLLLDFRRLGAEPGDQTALEDGKPVKIILRPDLEDRCCHHVTKAYLGPDRHYPAALDAGNDFCHFHPSAGHGLTLKLPGGRFVHEPEWHYMIGLPEEEERGLEAQTDLFSPGYFTFNLTGNEAGTLEAEITGGEECGDEKNAPPSAAPLPSHIVAENAMRKAMKHFLVKRDSSHTVIAGYPWFLDWGRDTLIALRGLIAAGWHREAADIIGTFAGFERNGTLPNMIRGNDDSNRDTSDAPLWLFVAVADLIGKQQSAELMEMDCRGRKLKEILISIAMHYMAGTPNGIRMDEKSGLIFSPSHYTWMDTNHPAGSPREGYPVEIQALWHFALRLLGEYDGGGNWNVVAERAGNSVNRLYPLEHGGFSDCLHCGPGHSPAEAGKDDACRPNQLFAITLGTVTDQRAKLGIIADCEELLVPGAIRSLADRPVTFPLPVRSQHDGTELNDPLHPYWGSYRGDEDSRRKPAYHNGTAWSWPFPSYCEAMAMTGGSRAKERARNLLMSAYRVLNTGCPGHTPEITDGDFPHRPRGCGAQAWGITELYRVFRILTDS